MKFRVTRHSALAPPADALDLLWQRLGGDHEGVEFTRAGDEIRAAWEEDAPVSMERDERMQIGRRAVLDIVSEVCDGAPELRLDWYAISPQN